MQNFICTWCNHPRPCTCSSRDETDLRVNRLQCPNPELISHWQEVLEDEEDDE